MSISNRKKYTFAVILLLFLVSVVIDLPRIPIKFHVGSVSVNTVIEHPNVNFNLWGTNYIKNLDPTLGLDLQGGTELVLKADMSKIPASQRDQALASARDVIERRVNLYGVSEPNIYTEKVGSEYRIVADLADVKDINQAKDLIGKTAQLEFLTLADPSNVPPYPVITDFNPNTNLTGADLTSASIVYESGSVTPDIQLNFSSKGLQKFSDIAKANVNKPVGISLDGQLISSPVIQPDLATGVPNSPVITGNFTVASATELVNQLDAGALPVPVNIIEENTVAPTLGAESVKVSIMAGIIGILLVLIFMVINYRFLGIIADSALLLYSALTFAIFILFPVTLTLAGIAGFILSIGMAVDANILIFERTKEELRRGKAKKVALRLGFERAWTSIRDSNVSSLITTCILYIFGTSIIKGFALTLAIGVAVSMFTAVFVTRNLLNIFYVKE